MTLREVRFTVVLFLAACFNFSLSLVFVILVLLVLVTFILFLV